MRHLLGLCRVKTCVVDTFRAKTMSLLDPVTLYISFHCQSTQRNIT